MKPCGTCRKELPKEKLYKRGKNTFRCRPCNTEIVRKWHATPEGKAAQKKADRIKYIRHKTKILARIKARAAVAIGSITKPKKCEACKLVKPLQGHHEDYSKPLEVIWLCTGCHGDADRILESAINRYGKLTAREFAEWLDEHGYKTFPDSPDYVS